MKAKNRSKSASTQNIAIAVLAMIVIGALVVYFVAPYFQGVKIIEKGDCADVHYIGKFASNGTVFTTSYDDIESKTGDTPFKLFVNPDMNLTIPHDFKGYSSAPKLIPQSVIRGLIGVKEGETKDLTIPPENAYGVWDVENTSEYLEFVYGVPYFPRITFWNFTDITYKDALTYFDENLDTSSIYVNQTIDYLEGILPSGENTTWQLKIINISGDNVTVQHLVENGTVIPPVNKYLRPVWNTTIVIDNETYFKDRHDPEIGDVFSGEDIYTGKPTHTRIMDMNDTAIILGKNIRAPSPDFVGETIIYEINVCKVYKTAQKES